MTMLAPTHWQVPVAPWAVINTHPHREEMALGNLKRQGFIAYCPMLRRRRSHGRRITTVLRPLFPSYLFVSTGTKFARWQPILSTYGVRSLVCSGQNIVTICHAFIVQLRAREVDGVIVRPPEPYQIGQTVTIADGPFDGLVATIIHMDEKDRLVVLLDLMNRSTSVTLSAHQVTAA
jgi:transcriptional antiterminator RfaH